MGDDFRNFDGFNVIGIAWLWVCFYQQAHAPATDNSVSHHDEKMPHYESKIVEEIAFPNIPNQEKMEEYEYWVESGS